MRILFIHNDNLPFAFLDLVQNSPVNNHSFAEYIVRKLSNNDDEIDTFLSHQLDNLMASQVVPDLIIIPYSLSQVNPIEFTGIRLVAHIRLSANDMWKRVPILFVGPHSLSEIIRINDLSSILTTPKVYMSDANTADSLMNWISTNSSKISPTLDSDYNIFLEYFTVPPPENYNDSHHSITNIWNILRWNEMLKWDDGKEPLVSDIVKEFSLSLYNKWLQVATGTREHFKKKKRVNLTIPFIQGKKIVHIDDDLKKGWHQILSTVFTSSEANYCCYSGFNPDLSKEELLSSIYNFLDSHKDADCYIIDLRMHEDDAISDNYQSYTGHLIAKYLYDQNPGNQVVLFTASDKVWNYVYSEKYCSDYITKENPLRLLSKQQSNELFADFSRAIQKACERTYLKDYYKHCSGNPYLIDFFEILRSDNDKQKLHEINMRSAALNLMVFIESTITSKYDISSTFKLISTATNKEEYSANDVYIESFRTPSGRRVASKVHVANSNLGHSDWHQRQNDMFLICATLIKHYGISEYVIDKVIQLKNIRNESIAHGGSYSKVNFNLLQEVFTKVVLPMIIKDTIV